jgi:hypothetical protein
MTSFSRIQVTSAESNSTAATLTLPSITITPGNALILGVFWKNDVNVSLVSGNSNQYDDCGVGRFARPVDGFLQAFLAFNAKVGATAVKIDFDGSAAEIAVYLAEWSGPTQVVARATGQATSGTQVSSGALRNTDTDALLWAFCVTDDTNGSAGAGFTSSQSTAGMGNITEYRIVSGEGIYTASANMSAAITKGGIIALALQGDRARAKNPMSPQLRMC